MHFLFAMQGVLALATVAAGQVYNVYNSITALSGTANSTNPAMIGNYYNYWEVNKNQSTYDLTRSDRMPVTSPKTIPMLGRRKQALIEPNRTAMIIVDMQNFFLHPHLSPQATRGRQAVQPTLNLIDAFRENGMKVLWVQWGIDNFDLVTMPPSFLESFSDDGTMATSFCTDMGSFKDGNGTVIEMGKKLCRDAWNSQPYGPLNTAMVKGMEDGTDLYFNKNRLSGLWGAQTPLGLYLQESETTTLFIGGVNSDQCVFSTYIDAFFKGFDAVYVEDCAGTTSPWYAEEMIRYNIDGYGFLANSTDIIDALGKQK